MALSPVKVITDPSKTTGRIYRYAQGALLLFAVSSVIAGWAGSKLGTIILVAVVVFGFMVALFGFERMSKARSGFYSKLGMFLATVTLLCILSLFITVLIYIGSGKPVWLDRFFGYTPANAPTAILDAGDITHDSAVLRVDPFLNEDAQIRIRVFQGNLDQLIKTEIISQNDASEYKISDLQSAQAYTVRIDAKLGNRFSVFADNSFVTDALNEELEFNVGGTKVSVSYTGDMLTDGTPNSDLAKVSFIGTESNGVWEYQGPVMSGQLDGTGELAFEFNDDFENECYEDALNRLGREVCRPKCSKITFQKGSLVEATCTLIFRETHVSARPNILTDRLTSVYQGRVIASSRRGYSSNLPFNVSFDGEGVLTTYFDDGFDISVGSFEDGRLNGVAGRLDKAGKLEEGNFVDGELVTGNVYNHLLGSDASYSYQVVSAVPFGAAIALFPDGFEFGSARGSAYALSSGFAGYYRGTNFILSDQLERAPDDRTITHSRLHPESSDCLYYEFFGRKYDDAEWFFNREIDVWPGLIFEGDGFAIDVKTPVTTTQIVMDDALKISTPAYYDSMALVIDGRNFEPIVQIPELADLRAPLIYAAACSAKEVQFPLGRTVTENDNFCEPMAVGLARAYYCTGGGESFEYVPDPKSGGGAWEWRIYGHRARNREHTSFYGAATLASDQDNGSFNIGFAIRLYCQKYEFVRSLGFAAWDRSIAVSDEIKALEFRLSSSTRQEETFVTAPNEFGVFEPLERDFDRFWSWLAADEPFVVKFSDIDDNEVIYTFAPHDTANMREAMVDVCRSI